MHLRNGEASVFHFPSSPWRAIRVNRNSILAQSIIIFTSSKGRKVNFLEDTDRKANVLRRYFLVTPEIHSLRARCLLFDYLKRQMLAIIDRNGDGIQSPHLPFHRSRVLSTL